MPSTSRGWSLSQLWRNDEEMASKKDDDLSLPRHARQAAPRGAPRRSVLLRFAAYALVLLLLVYGLYRIAGPSSEVTGPGPVLEPPTRRVPDAPPAYAPIRMDEPTPLKLDTGDKLKTGVMDEVADKLKNEEKAPVKVAENNKQEEEPKSEPPMAYNGPLKLPALGPSIRSIAETGGVAAFNRNVLFAAASLQSAAVLLPMACQMAAELQNYVHFALMSRSDVPMQDLLKMNGIDISCPVIVHDSRPDYPTTSTESRMTLAVVRSLAIINMYMHPQAVIVDASNAEEAYFLAGVRAQSKSMTSPLIELPDKAATRFSWLTKLDSSALAAWNNVHFDILVHAPPSGSGNLKRLLKSLLRADLGGIATPHITIELPSIIEPHLESFLAGYRWPPVLSSLVSRPQMLSLRHRIPRHRANEEESSVRFLESFWPNKPSDSHVLVLSPHTEVTPQFFQYVKFSLLHQRYSTIATRQQWNNRLFGISYVAPITYLDDTNPFTPPKPLEEDAMESAGTSFLWQAPNSDAILIMGDKWVELHGYVSQFLEKQHSMSAAPELLSKKEVGKKHPAWLEYALQLSRLRGYFTLYPSQQTAGTILGVHTDLHDVPEEYEGQEDEEGIVSGAEPFDPTSQIDMLATLPHEGELLSIRRLPWLTWDGKETDDEAIESDVAQYKGEFRRQVGQCDEAESKRRRPADLYAKDLFCIA